MRAQGAGQYRVAARQSPSLAVKASWSQETVYPKIYSPSGARNSSSNRHRHGNEPGLLSQSPGATAGFNMAVSASQAKKSSPVRRSQRQSKEHGAAMMEQQKGQAAGLRVAVPQLEGEGENEGNGGLKLVSTRRKVGKFHKLLDDMLWEVRRQYPHLPPPSASAQRTSSGEQEPVSEEENDEDNLENVDKVAAELIEQAWSKLCRVRDCYQDAYARAYDKLHDLLDEAQEDLQQLTTERDTYASISDEQASQMQSFSQELGNILPEYLRSHCTEVSNVDDLQHVVRLLANTLKQRDQRHEQTVGDLDRQVRSLRKKIAEENYAYHEPVHDISDENVA